MAMSLDNAVKLLEQYESAPDASMAEFLRTVHNQDVRGKDSFNGNDVWQASRILNQHAMEGGDISGVPTSIQKYTTPQYAQHIESQRAASGTGKTFGDQLWSYVTSPAVLTALGGVAGVYAGGAGAAAGAAEGGTTAGTTAAGTTAAGTTAAGTTAGTAMPAAVAPASAGYTAAPFVSASGAPATAYTLSNPSLAAATFAAPAAANAGGTTTTGTGTTTGTSTAARETALQKILNGTATSQDYLTVFGQAAPSLLGMYAADKQADALGDQAARYEAMGAPYRTRLGELYSDPTAFLKSPEVQVPVQQGTDALARALSVRGNPAGSGTALHELQNYASNQLFGRLGQEKDRLAGFGGLTAYNAAAPGAATNAIGAERGVYDALGYGIGSVTNPPRSLQDILKQYNVSAGLV